MALLRALVALGGLIGVQCEAVCSGKEVDAMSFPGDLTATQVRGSHIDIVGTGVDVKRQMSVLGELRVKQAIAQGTTKVSTASAKKLMGTGTDGDVTVHGHLKVTGSITYAKKAGSRQRTAEAAEGAPLIMKTPSAGDLAKPRTATSSTKPTKASGKGKKVDGAATVLVIDAEGTRSGVKGEEKLAAASAAHGPVQIVESDPSKASKKADENAEATAATGTKEEPAKTADDKKKNSSDDDKAQDDNKKAAASADGEEEPTAKAMLQVTFDDATAAEGAGTAFLETLSVVSQRDNGYGQVGEQASSQAQWQLFLHKQQEDVSEWKWSHPKGGQGAAAACPLQWAPWVAPSGQSHQAVFAAKSFSGLPAHDHLRVSGRVHVTCVNIENLCVEAQERHEPLVLVAMVDEEIVWVHTLGVDAMGCSAGCLGGGADASLLPRGQVGTQIPFEVVLPRRGGDMEVAIGAVRQQLAAADPDYRSRGSLTPFCLSVPELALSLL